MKQIEFVDSAFRHGFDQRDLLEVLSRRYLKLRSQRGLLDIYELFGRNLGGAYIHIVYRLVSKGKTMQVFHIAEMNERQKRRFKRIIK